MSKNKNNQVEELEVIETAVEEVVEETATEGFGAKVWGAVKKHGTKIARGAVILGGLALAFALGKNSADADDEDEADYIDAEFDEIEYGSDDAE